MRPPNIIWIFPDEWRHDAVGYAGNPVISTPHLDALAARGIAFKNAYCESPVCAPSRASLLTLSYPRDHGKVHNGPPGGDFPSPDAPNFLHRLQAVGYRTGEVGKMHFHHGLHSEDDLRAYGFHDVAEEYDKIMQRSSFVVEMDTPYTRYLDERGLLDAWRKHQDEQTEILMGRDPQGRPALPEALDPEHALDTFIGRQLAERIEEYAGQDEPFFLWGAFVGPHLPFDGPPPYADRYDPAVLPMGPLGQDPQPANRYGAWVAQMVEMLHADQWDEADHRLIAKHYYASISLVDAAIGQVVDAVERAGIAEDTWIMVSSDHGELLGDHGMLTKGVFYEASVKVPVLVVPPPGDPRGGGGIEGLVQGFDVPATILDVAGADSSGFLGTSLLELADRGGRPAVFSQIDTFTMVATDRFTLVVTSDTLEPQVLYDRARDPDERQDLASDPAYREVVRDLMGRWVEPFAAGDIPGQLVG